MNKSQFDEILKFIEHLNKNSLKEARKVLLSFMNQPYYSHIFELFNAYFVTKPLQSEYIEQQNSNLKKQKERIQELQNSQINKYYKSIGKNRDYGEQMNKAEVFEYLTIGNYKKVRELCISYKIQRALEFLQNLSEYIYIKLMITTKNVIKQNQEFSKEGIILKTRLMNNQDFRHQLNKKVSNALQSIFSYELKDQFSQQELPSSYFSSETVRWMNHVAASIAALKSIINKSDQENKLKIVQAVSIMKINLKTEGMNFNVLLDTFLRQVCSCHKSQNKLIIKSQVNMSSSLLQNLSQLIKKSQLKNVQLPILNPHNHNQSIFYCFKSLIQSLIVTREIQLATKQYVRERSQKQLQVRSILLKIHQELRIRAPSICASSAREQIWQLAHTFQKDIEVLLFQFDKIKKQRKEIVNSMIMGIKQEEQVISTDSSNNSIEQKNRQDIYRLQQQIQQLKKQVEDLRQTNKKQKEKRQVLEQENQEERKIVHRYSKQIQALVQKLKAYQISASSIINIPFIGPQGKDSNLIDQITTLRLENSRLQKALSENQACLTNFQLRLEEGLKKKKIEYERQIQKWKKKYSQANIEIDQYHQQIRLLHVCLQEKMFTRNSYHNQNTRASQKNLKELQTSENKTLFSTAQTSMICSLQQKIQRLNLTIAEKEKENIECKIKEKKMFEELQNEWRKQRECLEQQIKQLKVKIAFDSNSSSLHLFPPGFIFYQQDHQQRQFLLKNLTSFLGNIKKTRLLYRCDEYSKVNFHRYIDHQRHIVLVAKTIYGKLIAGYSEQPFNPQGINKGFGMILSLWSKKVFRVRDKKAISYDDYFVIFGNSELRIRSLQLKLFSNFGIANSYYDNQGEKVHIILGEGAQREVDLLHYEFYALDLDE